MGITNTPAPAVGGAGVGQTPPKFSQGIPYWTPTHGILYIEVDPHMNCERCGKGFEAAQRTQRFCSERCRKQAERLRHYLRANEFNPLFKEKPCAWCGTAIHTSKATCSNECSQMRTRYKAYGVHSLAQLNAMKEHAGGHCEICGIAEKDAPKGTLHCDHDHVTGKPRGMLCMHCNQALGKFKDDVALLNRAIEYLS